MLTARGVRREGSGETAEGSLRFLNEVVAAADAADAAEQHQDGQDQQEYQAAGKENAI